MEDDFEVKMERCDEEFFENNCFGTYTFTFSNTVAKDWEQRRKRKIKVAVYLGIFYYIFIVNLVCYG